MRNSDAVPIRPERICKEISEWLPAGGVVVSDTGHSGMWTGQMIRLTRPEQRYLRCAGSLGWAFPATLGAKCALPDRPVIGFCGDGGFYYHLAELETAARFGINAIMVVNNNYALNQEKHLFDDAYERPAARPRDRDVALQPRGQLREGGRSHGLRRDSRGAPRRHPARAGESARLQCPGRRRGRQ